MTSYAKENEQGRQRAAQAIEDCRLTGDMPRLVQNIRKVAQMEDGVSTGFLYALAQQATVGRM